VAVVSVAVVVVVVVVVMGVVVGIAEASAGVGTTLCITLLLLSRRLRLHPLCAVQLVRGMLATSKDAAATSSVSRLSYRSGLSLSFNLAHLLRARFTPGATTLSLMSLWQGAGAKAAARSGSSSAAHGGSADVRPPTPSATAPRSSSAASLPLHAPADATAHVDVDSLNEFGKPGGFSLGALHMCVPSLCTVAIWCSCLSRQCRLVAP
jgi:hypothetical protein